MSTMEPKPVQKIEVNEKNVKLRFIIFIIAIIVVIVSGVFLVIGLTKKDSGWTEVTASPTTDLNCDEDFYLYYRLGTSGNNVNAELKSLSNLYTEHLEKTYILLNEYQEYDGYNNLCYINNNPNKEIEVDEFLYNSLKKITLDNNRLLYSGILVEYYDLIILADSYDTAYNLNPFYHEEKKAFVQTLANYANDSKAINLEFLDNNKVKLALSDEFINYCKDNELDTYLSFSYLKNAFITDYVADKLIENDFIYGSLSSYDGYFRNLDTKGDMIFPLNIIDYNGDAPTVLGTFVSQKRVSGVQFRDFRYYQRDIVRSYEFKNGKTINYYIDLTTGLPKASKSSLTSYEYNDSCVNIALKLKDVFISDEFSNPNNIKLIYVDGYIIYYNEEGIEFNNLLSYGEIQYKTEYKK